MPRHKNSDVHPALAANGAVSEDATMMDVWDGLTSEEKVFIMLMTKMDTLTEAVTIAREGKIAKGKTASDSAQLWIWNKRKAANPSFRIAYELRPKTSDETMCALAEMSVRIRYAAEVLTKTIKHGKLDDKELIKVMKRMNTKIKEEEMRDESVISFGDIIR